MAVIFFGFALIADAGPGPLIYPLAGSAVLAGLFLTLAFIAGGLWLTRISREQPAPYSRKLFWISLGGACLFGTVVALVIGLFLPPLLGVAVVLFGGGLYALILGLLPSKDTRHESPRPHHEPPPEVSDP